MSSKFVSSALTVASRRTALQQARGAYATAPAMFTPATRSSPCILCNAVRQIFAPTWRGVSPGGSRNGPFTTSPLALVSATAPVTRPPAWMALGRDDEPTPAVSGSTTPATSAAAPARHATQDAAARAILHDINPTSIAENLEYGGMVYRNADGTYSCTEPVKGSIAGVNPGGPQACPAGTVAVAYYHTHGGPDPRYDNENFSPADRRYADRHGIDGYVGTPGGRFGKYDRARQTSDYEDDALPR